MSRGGNKDSDHKRTKDTANNNVKDEQVHRDPDVGGVMQRKAYDVHARGRQESYEQLHEK